MTVSRNGEKTLKLKAATDCLETNATALLSGPGPMIFPEAVNRECDVSRPDPGEVAAHDPVAMDEARRIYAVPILSPQSSALSPGFPALSFAESPLDALQDADALIIVTEWKAFKSPDFDVVKSRLKNPLIFDGRNLFEPEDIKALGIEYYGIGRGN